MSIPKDVKVVVLDGALDDLDPDEVNEVMAAFQEAIESGTLMEMSEPVDMDELADEDPELYKLLMEKLEALDNKPTLH
jgi:hypothetical protein